MTKFCEYFRRPIKLADSEWQCYLTNCLLRTNYIMHTVLKLHTIDLRGFLKPLPCDFREGVSPTTLAVL